MNEAPDGPGGKNAGDLPLRDPANWAEADCVRGRLYRYVDEEINLPLVEILEADLKRLEGYEFFEPSWVIAKAPTVYAIYDQDDQAIFGPAGYADSYSAEKLVAKEGYGSVQIFREQHPTPKLESPVRDMDIWVRLGLRAKIFLPSLPRK